MRRPREPSQLARPVFDSWAEGCLLPGSFRGSTEPTSLSLVSQAEQGCGAQPCSYSPIISDKIGRRLRQLWWSSRGSTGGSGSTSQRSSRHASLKTRLYCTALRWAATGFRQRTTLLDLLHHHLHERRPRHHGQSLQTLIAEVCHIAIPPGLGDVVGPRQARTRSQHVTGVSRCRQTRC